MARTHQGNPGPAPCPHCRTRKAVRERRGLCQACWLDLSIRPKYPPLGDPRRLARGVQAPRGPRPPEPTDARPGSEDKILVLIGRAERGERLWHPADRRLGG